MKTKRLAYSIIVDSSAEDLFGFHIDTNNLLLITPPWISVKIESIETPFAQNSKISLLIGRYGVETRWVMEIEKMDFARNVTDKMLSGPFPYFRHERIFEELPNGQTLMNETIDITPPFGILGELFFPLIKKDMDKMFEFRHRATKKFFSK